MKPAPFAYVRASSIDEACRLLAEDDDSRLIAGGQTLVPMLAMRLARPSRLIDIARIAELAVIRDGGNVIAVGATTRQVTVEHDAIVAAKLPLLAKAMPWVGHPPTRNRGTIGGSIANADPAAELALVAVTLGAEMVTRSVDGEEILPADDFFIGPMLTAIPPGACLTEVRFPVWRNGRVGAGFQEISARRSDFAFASAAAQIAFDESGTCTACVAGIGGVGDRPVRLDSVHALIGTAANDRDIDAAVRNGTADLETVADLHASASYRRRAATALARRALIEARDGALACASGSRA
jgi:carbon-monoxide dehydrogenase medium subunit